MNRSRILIVSSFILLLGLCELGAQTPITVQVKQGWKERAGGLRANEILNQEMEVLDFRDADLQDVIRLIAAKANINILMNPVEVKGKVTLHLENVRLGVALHNILRTQGLTFVVREDENIVRIVNASLFGETGIETLTEIIPLKHLDAERFATDLQDLWPGMVVKQSQTKDEAKEGEGEQQKFEKVEEIAMSVTFHKESNSLLVMAPPPKLQQIRSIIEQLDKPQNATSRPQTTTVQLNWLDAEELAADLSKLYESTQLTEETAAVKYADVKKRVKGVLEAIVRIVPHKSANSIIVTAPSPLFEEIVGIIAELDVPQRQVSIEARLVDMNINAARDVGANLGMWKVDNDGNSPVNRDFYQNRVGDDGSITRDEFQQPVDIARTLLPLGTAAATGMQFGLGDTLNIFGETFNLDLFIAAMEQRNNVEVLASPSVVTLNKQEATMQVVQELPYITTAFSEGGAPQQTVNFKVTGVIIRVTPTITANGFVRMQIETDQIERIGQTLGVPVVDRRQANTDVIVSSGNTIMTGGLRQLRSSDLISGVPWFHRIPVLGWLFKTKSNSQERRQLFLFVTPQVLDEVVLTSEQRGWFDRLDTQWHLPDYFFDDVKTPEDMN
jgi:type IV pilus secretin PilQ/predicted competence protein